MTSGLRLAFAVLLFAGAIASAGAQSPAPAPQRQQVKIGFVEIAGDARYEPLRAYERIILKSREHPLTGAEVGIDEAAAFARVLPIDFALDRITAKSPADVAPAVRAALDAGTHFFLLDAPADAFKPLAAATLSASKSTRGSSSCVRRLAEFRAK